MPVQRREVQVELIVSVRESVRAPVKPRHEVFALHDPAPFQIESDQIVSVTQSDRKWMLNRFQAVNVKRVPPPVLRAVARRKTLQEQHFLAVKGQRRVVAWVVPGQEHKINIAFLPYQFGL
jgi:hypothetical protein